MLNSKKLLLHTLVLFFGVLAIIVAVCAPAFLNGSEYNDSAKRKELAGQIDYIFCGASHAMNAFDTAVIDMELGACTYNLSSSSAYYHGRSLLLQKELARNNLRGVVIEVAYDSLANDPKDGHATGEPYIICKLDTPQEKFSYFLKHVDFFNNDYENITSVLMRYGLKAWKAMLSGEFGNIQAQKGFMAAATKDISLSEADVVRRYQQEQSKYTFREENVAYLEEMIRACQEKNVPVMVVVVPVSEACIWETANMDFFHTQLKSLCEENNCPLFDFNLLKNRFELFGDTRSFSDVTHISIDGAKVFGKAFSEVLKKFEAGEETDHLFYSNYAEVMQNSAYTAIYQKQQ